MKRRWLNAAMLLIIGGLLWLLLDAQNTRAAAVEALRLCAVSVIPALFPFLVLSSLLIALGLGEWLARPLGGLMALFNIGGAGASALILGLVGGYPVGARTAAELYGEKLLTRDEAERLLLFCNNANPAFFMAVLGLQVFRSLRVGVWLWLIHLTAALLTGLALGRTGSLFPRRAPAAPRSPVRERPPLSRTVRFSEALVSSVRSAAAGMVSVCAFVVFFYVLALPLRKLGGPAGTLLAGLAELFSAVPRLTCDRSGLVLAAGLSGFGGVCVLFQTLSVLSGSGLSTRNCLRGKALQGLLSAALAAAMAPYILP